MWVTLHSMLCNRPTLKTRRALRAGGRLHFYSSAGASKKHAWLNEVFDTHS